MKKILQKEDKMLRKVAKEVPLKELRSIKTKKVLKDMSEALASQHDGVAIAAPQIGQSLRIFIISGKVLGETKNKKTPLPDMIFINPKILKLSREKEWLQEGCLSVRPMYGKTYRAKKATISAYDEKGKKFERGASGLLAQIFQHETDHLDGILFIDHAKELEEEVPPPALTPDAKP